ncbi:MAG: FAD binding domain-containing protein [Candidatus Rokuibacteriota bacterium]
MRLAPFELTEPASFAEALSILARRDGECRLIAGGTALVPMLRLGLARPDRLVSLHRIPGIAEIRSDGGALIVGAMATHAQVRRAAVVGSWPLLAEAAGRVASPAIRASGTLGGNLCYAEAASDVAPALLCLDALVTVTGAHGDRTVPVAGFFRGFFEAALEPGEILTQVRIAPPPPGAKGAYVKFCPRSAEDRALIGVAALLVTAGDGRQCRDVRLALGGAAPTPLRARRAEDVLRGEALTDPAIRAAADAAAGEADPLSDLMGSADYRREMVRVWVRRVLTSLRDGTRPV